MSRGAQFTIAAMSRPPSTPVRGAAARLRIVLVGTQHPGNIGSAARAMKTMGLSRLVLVAPEKAPDRETDALAAGADDVLDGAPVFATLAEAVADCRLVLGCTARSRRVQLARTATRATAAARARGRRGAGGRGRAGVRARAHRPGQRRAAAVPCRGPHPGQPGLQLAQPRRGGAGAELRSARWRCCGGRRRATPRPRAATPATKRPRRHAELEGLLRPAGRDPGRDRLPQGPRAGVGDAQAAPAVPARRPGQRRGAPAARHPGRCPAHGAAGAGARIRAGE